MTADRHSGVMTVSTSLPPTLAAVLRGDRSRRPLSDRQVAMGLRADLEDRLFELPRKGSPTSSVLVHTGDVRGSVSGVESLASTIGRLRGALIGQLLRLLVAGHTVDDPFTDALAAWRAATVASPLMELLNQLDAQDRARLATDVTAHAVTLSGRLGTIHPGWRPRTSVAAIQRIGGGFVTLKDRFDLVVGSPNTRQASLVLLDVTTSPLNPQFERVMRYHALVQTLLANVAPLRVVIFSSATNELWSAEVDDELLRRALDELSEVIAKKLESP